MKVLAHEGRDDNTLYYGVDAPLTSVLRYLLSNGPGSSDVYNL